MNSTNISKSFHRVEQEDPISTIFVENLLSGVNDWRNIQEIVRTTIKSLTEVVRNQSVSIRELEKQLSNKATRTELSNNLNTKANVSDIMRTFSEVASNIEQRPTFEDLQLLLEEKISKPDLQYLISSKPSLDEVKMLINQQAEDKTDIKNLESTLIERIDDSHKDINKKMNNFSTIKDIQNITSIIDTKANNNEINELLNSKASKESVLNALQRKMNKSEVDAIINNKVDISDFNNLTNTVKYKSDIEELEKLNVLLDSKADRSDIVQLSSIVNNKLELKDLEILENNLLQTKQEFNKKTSELDQDLDNLIENIKKEFQNVNLIITQIDQNKVEFKDLDKINSVLSKKADTDTINHTISLLKNDVMDNIRSVKTDLLNSRKGLEDRINNKFSTLEKLQESIQQELNHNNNKINDTINKFNADKEEMQNKVKAMLNNHSKDLANDFSNIKDDMNKLNDDLEDLYNKKCEKNEFDLFAKKIKDELDNKANIKQIDNLYKTLSKELLEKQDDGKKVLNQALKNFENDMMRLLDKKANLYDITTMMNNKADLGSTNLALQAKASNADLDKLRNAAEKLIKDLSNKLDYGKFESFMKDNDNILNNLQKDVSQKSNLKESLNMLKNKADIDDINKALTQIHDELDTKTQLEQVSYIILYIYINYFCYIFYTLFKILFYSIIV